MPSVVNSQELEVLVLLELAGGCAVNEPVLVLGTLELGLAGPLDSVGPGLTTSPVADEVLIAGVDEHTEASLEDSLYLGSEVVEPVTSEGEVDHLVALNPVAASHAKLGLDGGIVEETVGVAQVVAQRRHITLLADIVNVESRGKGVSENGGHGELAELESIDLVILGLTIVDHLNAVSE